MAEEPKKIRTGVVGVGSLGQWHARIYSEMPDVELVGVYDADKKRAQEIAERYHTAAFKTMEALADAAEALNIVVPTDKHRAVAGMVIEKGKHVLVEKPIAASTQEAEELVELAQKHGAILQVGHVERFNPVLDVVNKAQQKPLYAQHQLFGAEGLDHIVVHAAAKAAYAVDFALPRGQHDHRTFGDGSNLFEHFKPVDAGHHHVQ